MIEKVKKWLGIEGIKLILETPEEVKSSDGFISGNLYFFSQREQVVESVKIFLIERYERGKKEERRIDEYLLGETSLELHQTIFPGEDTRIPFDLPFSELQSEMDQWERKNKLFNGAVGIAKWFYGVKSTYRIEAEAKVEGTLLSPFDKKAVIIKNT